MALYKTLMDAYGEQLDDIGRILVRAGVLTEREIRRQGVRFAVRDRFEPCKPRKRRGPRSRS